MNDIIADINKMIELESNPALLNRTGNVSNAPPSIEFSMAEIVLAEL
jgi:hypothetical protein